MTARLSRVPTQALERSGVKTKWFRGEMTVMSYLSVSMSLIRRAPPHPTPRMTRRSRPVCKGSAAIDGLGVTLTEV